MTDFVSLAAVVSALYLSECCWLIPRGSLVWRSIGRRVFLPVYPSAGLGNEFAGLVLVNPLPPLGTAFQCERWPISVTAEGILSFVAQTTDPVGRPRYPVLGVPFSEVQEVSDDGRTLSVNSRVFCKVGSEASAARWAGLLSFWSGLPVGERASAIAQTLAAAFDPLAVERRVREYREVCKSLRVWCHALMILWLVGLPVVVGIHELRYLVLPWLILLGATLVVVAVHFYRAYRALMPEARGYRLKSLLMMALNPGVAIRACDAVGRHLLAEFHPLAVAIALSPADQSQKFARSVIADLRHPLELPDLGSPESRAVEEEFRRQLTMAAQTLLAYVGIDVETLMMPPQPEDDSCRAYCPRCDRQYYGEAESCTACGVVLEQWPESANVSSHEKETL